MPVIWPYQQYCSLFKEDRTILRRKFDHCPVLSRSPLKAFIRCVLVLILINSDWLADSETEASNTTRKAKRKPENSTTDKQDDLEDMSHREINDSARAFSFCVVHWHAQKHVAGVL